MWVCGDGYVSGHVCEHVCAVGGSVCVNLLGCVCVRLPECVSSGHVRGRCAHMCVGSRGLVRIRVRYGASAAIRHNT